MDFIKEFISLEQLRIPLLITKKNGTVLYKNSILSSHIKKPRRCANIYKYIPGCAEESDAFPGGLPAYAIIEYKEGSGLDTQRHARRAFVFEFRYNGEELLTWLFPRRIHYLNSEHAASLLPFYTERLGTLLMLLKMVYDAPPSKIERSLPFSRSPESVYDSIMSNTAQRRGSDNFDIPTDLAFFIKTFGECAARQLRLRGFRFELHCETLRVSDMLTIAGLELATQCAQLIYASLLISGGHKLIWDCFRRENTLTFEFSALYPEGREAPVCVGTMYEAAVRNPEVASELFFCELLWSAPGRRISWESCAKSTVLRVHYSLESPKFVILRHDDMLTKQRLNDKINEIIEIIGTIN